MHWTARTAVVFAATFLLAELALRVIVANGWLPPLLYGPSNPYVAAEGTRFLPDFEGFRNFRGGKIPFRTNETGFRASFPYRTGSPEHPVVAVIGDSYVLASEIPEPDTFTALLGASFAKAAPPAEVQNYGMGGTGIPHYVTRWETSVSPHRPRLTIVCLFGGNDIADSVPELSRYPFLVPRYRRDASGRIVSLGPYAPPPLPPWANRLASSLLLHPLLFRPNPESSGLAYTLGTYFGDGDPRYERAWSDIGDLFALLRRETHARGSALLAIWISHPLELDDSTWARTAESYRDRRPDRDRPRRRMAALLARADVPFLDSTPVLREALAAGVPVFLEGDGHFSAEGHRLFAHWLFPEAAAALGGPLTEPPVARPARLK